MFSLLSRSDSESSLAIEWGLHKIMGSLMTGVQSTVLFITGIILSAKIVNVQCLEVILCFNCCFLLKPEKKRTVILKKLGVSFLVFLLSKFFLSSFLPANSANAMNDSLLAYGLHKVSAIQECQHCQLGFYVYH